MNITFNHCMDLETANYIVIYFNHLLTSDERGAIQYQYFFTQGNR
jgi:hypothetical protein